MSKKKGQKMGLNDFLNSGGATNWADDVIELPSAPAATFDQPVKENTENTRHDDERDVPHTGPFTAYVGNLSFDVTDRDIAMFFGDLNLKGSRIMMDFQTMKPKGFAYAEFEDRDSLVQALKMNGESLLNRSVRINVADQPKNKRSEPVFSSNWRQKPAEGGDRTFRDQFTKREPTSAFGGQGFSRDAGREYSKPAPVWGRKEGSNPFSKDGSAFAPKESESIAQRSSKPKVNPFGNAVAKDVHSIQQSILEKKEKQEPKNFEALAKKEISSNQKDQQPKKPVDNVPTRSWRSRGADTKKKESVFSQAMVGDKSREKNENSGDKFKVASKHETKKPTEKSKPAENRPLEKDSQAGKKSDNVYDLLEHVLITNGSNEEYQVLR